MPRIPDFHYIGSFQRGHRFESENPLEEVWTRVAQHGSAEHLRAIFKASPGQDLKPYVQYATVRIRQAVEFRNAARQSTLLTSPLPLYYSFLNLTRTFLCIGPEVMNSKGHGLTFKSGTGLLDSGAKLTRGTFTDYLSACGNQWNTNRIINLGDVLSRIIEVKFDYVWPLKRESYVVPVQVEAFMEGTTFLKFPDNSQSFDFKANWQSEFPSLAHCCTIEPGQNRLKLKRDLPKEYKAVTNFCTLRLERDLHWRESATWYLVRQVDNDLHFPRPMYYFLAIFILGSIVRYQPELMIEATNPDSQIGWLLKRVVQAAERYFPQLMLSWVSHQDFYFQHL